MKTSHGNATKKMDATYNVQAGIYLLSNYIIVIANILHIGH